LANLWQLAGKDLCRYLKKVPSLVFVLLHESPITTIHKIRIQDTL